MSNILRTVIVIAMLSASGQSTSLLNNEGKFAFAALVKNWELIDLVSPENAVGIAQQSRLEKYDDRKVILACQPPGGSYAFAEYRIIKFGFTKRNLTKCRKLEKIKIVNWIRRRPTSRYATGRLR